MRVSVGSNEYRTVLFAIDNSNVILSMSSFFRIARALGIEFTPTFIL
jgi:hypothetical protein